jgi:SAM-dependent methyltransferase
MNQQAQKHWNKVYNTRETETLGWYEEQPNPSLDLVESCHLDRHSVIFNAGAGSSFLIDALLDKGYQDIVACDISEAALDKLKERLGPERAKKVRWVTDDLTNSRILTGSDVMTVSDVMTGSDVTIGKHSVDLWHDRAVLHFFTTVKEQDAYFNLLDKLLKPGGYTIIAAFSLDGADMCSGLPVHRYSADMLENRMGPGYSLLEQLEYTYHTPSGNPRPYIYTLFRKK